MYDGRAFLPVIHLWAAFILRDQRCHADEACGYRAIDDLYMFISEAMALLHAREGTQIIPAAWIDDIVENGSADAWDAGVFAPFFPGRKMHYRVDLGEAPLLFALGIHGQYLFVDRRNQLVIVMMSSQANPLDAELISLTMTESRTSVKFSHSLNRRPRRLD